MIKAFAFVLEWPKAEGKDSAHLNGSARAKLARAGHEPRHTIVVEAVT